MADTTGSAPRSGPFRALLSLVGAAATGRLRRYEIAESSMRPTLNNGDWVVAVVRSLRPAPGDVVVLDHPDGSGMELVKRIHSIDRLGIIVLGDDPAAGSVDSVTFGPVAPQAITARILLRYKPWPPRLVR